MGDMASQITSLTIVYSTVYSGADQRKHQNSVPLAFVRGFHQWPVNSPHKGTVTRNMLPFDDVIIRKWPSTCIDLIKGNISVSPTPGRSAKWNKSHVLILCTLLHRQNGHHFANIFTFICLLEHYCIFVQIALKSLTKGLVKLSQIVFYTDSAPGRRQSIIWTNNGHVFFQYCLNPCQWNSTMKTSVEKISVILTNH